jgi:hypothetical protein
VDQFECERAAITREIRHETRNRTEGCEKNDIKAVRSSNDTNNIIISKQASARETTAIGIIVDARHPIQTSHNTDKPKVSF